jgi:hypothetical protein
MRMWYELDFDLDSFLDSMEEEKERTPAWKRVEQHEDKRRLMKELAWYPEDDMQDSE